MEISESLYNWLKDANTLLQPPLVSRGIIRLQLQDTENLESGLVLGQLLVKIGLSFPPLTRDKFHNWQVISSALESIGIDCDDTARSLILGGDRGLLQELLNEIQSYDKLLTRPQKKNFDALLLGNIDPGLPIKESQSCLEFLILSLCQCFGLTPKQSAGLMSQEGKYLEHLLIKGLKGDFEPVFQWYNLMLNHMSVLSVLMFRENGALSLVLNTLKFGLKSENPLIYKLCTISLVKLHFVMKTEDELWDWFLGHNVIVLALDSYDRVGEDLCESTVNLLFAYGKSRLLQVFGEMLYDHYTDSSHFFRTSYGFLQVLDKVNAQLQEQGVIQYWMEQSLRDIYNSSRLSAVLFICEIWNKFTENIDANENLANSALAEINKIGSSSAGKVTLIGKKFELLKNFMVKRTAYLPLLYKSLVFDLIENSREEIVRDFILSNFVLILEEGGDLDLSVIIEAYVKQPGDINTFDFEFLIACGRTSNIKTEDCLSILHFSSNLFFKDFRFSSSASVAILLFVAKFKDRQRVHDFVYKFLAQGFKLVLDDKKHLKIGLNDLQDDKEWIHLKNIVLKITEKFIQLREFNENIKELLIFFSKEAKRINLHIVKNIRGLLDMLGYERNFKSETQSVYSNPLRIGTPHTRAISMVQALSQKRKDEIQKERSYSEKRQEYEAKVKRSLKKQIDARKVELGVKTHDSDTVMLLNYSKISRIELFEPDEESEYEQELLAIVNESYQKVCTQVFSRYVFHGYKLNSLTKNNFEGTSDSKGYLKEGQAITLLRDNGITKEMLSTEHIKQIYRYLVQRYKINFLKIDTFQSFLYHCALNIFQRGSSRDLSYFPSAIALKSLYEMLNKNSTVESDVIASLNKELQEDCWAPLPEGFKKVKEFSLDANYTVPGILNFPDKYQIALEVLDSILNESIGVHILEPNITVTEIWKAKSVLNKPRVQYSEEFGNVPTNKAAYKVLPLPAYLNLSTAVKVEVKKLTGEVPNDILMECGRVLDDLIHSVSEQSEVLISRNPRIAGTIDNPIKKQREKLEILEKSMKLRSEAKRQKRAAELHSEIKKFYDEQDRKETERLRQIEEMKEKARIEKEKAEQLKQKQLQMLKKSNSKKKNAITPTQKVSDQTMRSSFAMTPKPVKENFFSKAKKKMEEYNKKKKAVLEVARTIKEPELPAINNVPLEGILKPKEKQLYESIDKVWEDSKVQGLFESYKSRLFYIYENYSKHEKGSFLKLNSFNRFLTQFNIVPCIIGQDKMHHIFKSVNKKKQSLSDGQASLNFIEFKQILLKIALIGTHQVDTDLERTSSEPTGKLQAFFDWMSIPKDLKSTRNLLKNIEDNQAALNPRDKKLQKNDLVKQLTLK